MLSLVIPCFNEQDNIPLIVARLREVFRDRDDAEVLLVDNGSKDATGARITSETAADPLFRLVTVPVNKGYGFGIKAGLAEAKGDVLAWTHADMQTDPQDVLRALDLFKSKSDDKIIVKGNRQNRRLLEEVFTFGMQLVASAALRTKLHDVNAQPKLFAREFYERHLRSGSPDDFSLDLYLLYRARHDGYGILAVPVVFANRMHGEAKGGGSWRSRVKLIKRTFAYIFELRRSVGKQVTGP